MSKVKRTLTQRKFIDGFIKHNGNSTQAYLELHPNCTYESAKELGHRMLTKVDLSVSEILEKIGLTNLIIGEKLKEGLNAQKVISVIPIKLKKNQENSPDLPDANSKNIEFIEVDDWNIQHKFVETILKLNNEYPAEKIEHSGEINLKPLKVIIRKKDKGGKNG